MRHKAIQKGNKKLGFTLIELLVVISIIGVLSALILVNFNSARERTRDIQRKTDLDQIRKALKMYYNDYGSFPANDSRGKIIGCGSGATPVVCDWGGQWSRGGMIYMKILPKDPKEGQSYQYFQRSSGQDFCLWATLENTADSDISKSQSRCSTCLSGGGGSFVVCNE